MNQIKKDATMKLNFKEAIDYVIRNTSDKTNISRNIAKVKEYFNSQKCNTDLDLAYLEGKNKDDYIHDMKIAQNYAKFNRKQIAKTICEKMNWQTFEIIETVHNYLGDDKIIRKSAISANLGEKVVIPMNMRDGTIIAVGKGNKDWNCSAPHGAGRSMSRSKAKKDLKIDDFKKSMSGIYTSCVSENTIDEAPMAYKDANRIIDEIGDTVEILKKLKPIYNFKASE